MNKPISFGELGVELVSSMGENTGIQWQDEAFNIVIIGDFSGRQSRGIFDPASIATRPFVEVDRDNIDEVMKRLKVEVHLDIGDSDGLDVVLKDSDDLHPDSLYERLDVFNSLRDVRNKLGDNRTFESAARVVRAWKDHEQEGYNPHGPPSKRQDNPIPKEGLLESILGEETEKAVESSMGDWDVFLRRIVAPHIIIDNDRDRDDLIAAVDESTSVLMKTILHDRDFQSIESAWRSLDLLVSRLETSESMRIFILDITKAELISDLKSSQDLSKCGIFRLFADQADEIPLSLTAGYYTFGMTASDAMFLGRMAKIVSITTSGPFISGARILIGEDGDIKVSDNDAAAWDELRGLNESGYLGLVMPGFLLRLPYGEDTDPVEGFQFEEMDFKPEQNHYLWANPCMACVCLLGQTFSMHGWDMRPGMIRDIQGLPLHVCNIDGKMVTMPCTESMMNEKQAQDILEMGIMPVVSYKDQDRLSIVRFQSLADPAQPLNGRWGH